MVAVQLREEFTVSERRACRVLDQPRTSQRYQAQPRDDEAALVKRILELVREHPRYGYRLITAKLRQEGWHVNAKRVYRLWRREGLKVPQKVTGQTLAQAYLSRWKIENAFHKLTMVLRCELNTLGYPQAALFGFCLAVAMYNAVNTVLAALRAAHPAATEEAATRAPKFSFYYLADEIAGVSRGMAIVIADEHWTAAFAGKTSQQMARKLLWLARKVHIDRFLTNPTSVKRRKARRPIKHGGHVSTHRILQQRKNTTKT